MKLMSTNRLQTSEYELTTLISGEKITGYFSKYLSIKRILRKIFEGGKFEYTTHGLPSLESFRKQSERRTKNQENIQIIKNHHKN